MAEQAELGSRPDGLDGALVGDEEDGHVAGAVGAGSIRVVQDAPCEGPNLERAGLDALAVGELLLGARVALDVEQMVPSECASDNGRGGAAILGIRVCGS